MSAVLSLLDKNTRRILEYFLANPNKELAPPEIERHTGVAHTQVYKKLKKLLEKNIIKKGIKVFKTQFYVLNTDNEAVKELMSLGMTTGDGVKIDFNGEILRAVKIVWSMLLRSKNKRVNKMSLSDTVQVLLLIALQSNIKPDDPRMEAIKDYIHGRKIFIDDKKMEKLGIKIAKGAK